MLGPATRGVDRARDVGGLAIDRAKPRPKTVGSFILMKQRIMFIHLDETKGYLQ
jgi:hypothetical protein